MRPPSSPATMAQPFATAQHRVEASQENVAIVAPLSSSHTLSVLSWEAETARRPSGVTATALAWPWWVSSSQPLSSSHYLGKMRRSLEGEARHQISKELN
jgi:hypothetical protein